MNDDTASVAEEADRVNEVTIEMVDNQKEMESKDMATQTDIDLAAIVCAWERSYDPKNKKDYTCSPLQLEESSSTKHINDEGSSLFYISSVEIIIIQMNQAQHSIKLCRHCPWYIFH